ncbi:hypothetical protein FDZ74_03380 [bacterium]|nr:MAG: hypothetical protein FDZ74_03380 [bacterium]
MKTIENTPSVLALRRIPTVIWLVGLFCLLLGLGLTYFLGKLNVLQCQRLAGSGSCQLASIGLFGNGETRTFPLASLRGATVESSEDGEGGVTYRVAIQFDDGSRPLTTVYSSGYAGKETLANRINQFIANPGQAELSIRQDDRFLGMLFGGILALTALAMVALFGQVVTLRLDRTTGLATLKRAGLLGVREGEYPLRDFSDAVLEYHDNISRIALVTRDGGHLPLTPEFTSGARGQETVAKKIRDFLRPGGWVDNQPEGI